MSRFIVKGVDLTMFHAPGGFASSGVTQESGENLRTEREEGTLKVGESNLD